MHKKIAIAVGGTGGHVFPALRLAKEIKQRNPKIDIFFIGVGLAKNAYFPKENVSYLSICGDTISRKKNLFSSIFQILKGIGQGYKQLRKKRPDLIIGFGSFHSFPALLASKLLRIPLMLFEANAYPGKVNRHFSKSALFTAVQFKQASVFLNGVIKNVKFLSGSISSDSMTKEEALAYFGLKTDLPTLLVFGGSQGAIAINERVIKALEGFSNPVQVIHIIGKNTSQDSIQEAYEALKIPAVVKPFEAKMEMAWKAADLAICRSGASSIAEHIFFEVPSLFLPYPSAMNDHQTLNAFLASNAVRGSLVLPEKKCTFEDLTRILKVLFKDKQKKLKAMSSEIHLYKKNTSKEELSELIIKFLS